MSYRYFGTRESKPTIREVLWPDGVKPKVIAIDTETISLRDKTPIGISITVSTKEALYFSTWPDGDNEDIPWELVNDPTITRLYHNAPFDFAVLKDYGPNPYNVVDTLAMVRMLGKAGILSEVIWQVPYNSNGYCRQEIAGTKTAKTMLDAASAKTMLELDEDDVAVHGCDDAMATIAIYLHFKDEMDWDYLKMEMDLLPILVNMSNRGIAIDPEQREYLEEMLTDEMLYYRSLAEAEGFNPGSPQQVGYVLAKRGTFLPFKRGGRSLTTDVGVLETVTDPMASIVLQYRHYNKLLGTYVRPLKNQDRAYTRFHLDAATGRISSTDRNLQNVPPVIRPMFIPDSGVFTDMDFSQIELRILAHLSGDREMQFIFDAGGSIHQATAEFLNIPYKRAKNTGFGMIYGGTDECLMETCKTRDVGMVRRFRDGWAKKYREAWDWIQFQHEWGLQHGKVRTILGRDLYLPVDEGEGRVKRCSVSYAIQGSAAEALKKALLICQDMDLAHQVHDEIIVDGIVEPPEELEHVLPEVKTPVSMKLTERWE